MGYGNILDEKEPTPKISFSQLKNNPYLPLDQDWFIKPLLFSKKANNEGNNPENIPKDSLRPLFTEIFSYLVKLYVNNEHENPILHKIFGNISYARLLSMALEFVTFAYIQDNTTLISKSIIAN